MKRSSPSPGESTTVGTVARSSATLARITNYLSQLLRNLSECVIRATACFFSAAPPTPHKVHTHTQSCVLPKRAASVGLNSDYHVFLRHVKLSERPNGGCVCSSQCSKFTFLTGVLLSCPRTAHTYRSCSE